MLGLWADVLSDEVIEVSRQAAERASVERSAGKVVYPAQENIFRALEVTPPENLRVLCLAQVILSAVCMGIVGTLGR